MLWQCPVHERRNIRAVIADRPEAVWHAQPLHEPRDPVCENAPRILYVRGGDIHSERGGSFKMPRRRGLRRKPEDRRRIQDDGHAVRHERMSCPISSIAILLDPARYWVRHAMWKVY